MLASNDLDTSMMGSPAAANSTLARLQEEIFGVAWIVDPYIADASDLDWLLLDPNPDLIEVKIVTDVPAQDLDRRSFQEMSNNANIKLAVRTMEQLTARSWHDRFIATSARCWILGSSLNQIGEKVTFLHDIDNSTILDSCKEWTADPQKKSIWMRGEIKRLWQRIPPWYDFSPMVEVFFHGDL